jgi:large subunit ribosomal protein L5
MAPSNALAKPAVKQFNLFMERLQEQFNKQIIPQLQKDFGYKNIMQVPRITKVVLNAGIGKFTKDQKFVDNIKRDLANIAGQATVETKARKSIAGFKVRENQTVGLMVTLRGQRMYSFLDKLINVALPRVKDFRGVNPKGFDGRGNYHLGLREQIVFPEVSSEAIESTFGLEISIVTNAGGDAPARALLKLMNFPFTSKEEK